MYFLCLFVLCGALVDVLAGSADQSGVSGSENQIIRDAHNYYRNKVAAGGYPVKDGYLDQPASNMMWLVWDQDLAKAAQAHADKHVFSHDRPATGQYAKNGYGQNLYTSSAWPNCLNTDWNAAVTSWTSESKDFEKNAARSYYSPSNSKIMWGHFSQVVWAESQKVGCGHARYMDGEWCKHLYTCNYYPPGNYLNEPMYNEGRPCSSGNSTFPNLCKG